MYRGCGDICSRHGIGPAAGEDQVNGHRRMQDRLQELRALAVLEEMSDTKAFADALGSAGLAPTALTAADKAAAKALLADPGTDNPPKHNA